MSNSIRLGLTKEDITLRNVRAAYTKTRLTPRRHTYKQGECACAFGAIMTQKGVDTVEFMSGIEEPAEVLGLSQQFVTGFVNGFDGSYKEYYDVKEYVDGYELGEKIWQGIQDLIPEEER